MFTQTPECCNHCVNSFVSSCCACRSV